MVTITIPKKEYQNIIQRQLLIEKEIAFFKKYIFEFNEENILPEVLEKWERVSQKLDRGNGCSFSSVSVMKRWLKNL